MRKENQPRLTTAPSSKSIELLLQDWEKRQQTFSNMVYQSHKSWSLSTN
jgi:hypothetical protein